MKVVSQELRRSWLQYCSSYSNNCFLFPHTSFQVFCFPQIKIVPLHHILKIMNGSNGTDMHMPVISKMHKWGCNTPITWPYTPKMKMISLPCFYIEVQKLQCPPFYILVRTLCLSKFLCNSDGILTYSLPRCISDRCPTSTSSKGIEVLYLFFQFLIIPERKL